MLFRSSWARPDRVIPAAMEAKLVDALPTGPGWRFEPKWDGFRALVLRDGDQIEIQSKSGKPRSCSNARALGISAMVR